MQSMGTIMVTVVRILLLTAVLVLPGGLLLLPFLAVYQVKHSKKSVPVAASHEPIPMSVRS
jgi:hypothetical protein